MMSDDDSVKIVAIILVLVNEIVILMEGLIFLFNSNLVWTWVT